MARRRPLRPSGERPAAWLQVAGKDHFLGRWDTAEQVAIARQRAILHFGVKGRIAVQRARRLGAASPEELRRLALMARKRASGKSLFYGVSFDRKRQAFFAKIRPNGRLTKIGFFDTEREAALAVDRLSVHVGLSARNFPPGSVRAASLEELRREIWDNPRWSPQTVRKIEPTSRYADVVYAEDNPARPGVVYFSGAARVRTAVASFESERCRPGP